MASASTITALQKMFKSVYLVNDLSNQSVFPTPANTHLRGSPPAAITRRNSPSLTTSKPLPNFAKTRMMAAFEFAFIA